MSTLDERISETADNPFLSLVFMARIKAPLPKSGVLDLKGGGFNRNLSVAVSKRGINNCMFQNVKKISGRAKGAPEKIDQNSYF